MPDSPKSAAQFLAELRKERDELNALIHALEKRGVSAATQDVSETAEEEGELGVGGSTAPLTIGFFHNLSQAAAAEKLLKLHPHKALSTGEILQAFRDAGMQLHQRDASTILYTALKRSHKFERVGNKAWGLKEWYPDRKRRVPREQQVPEEEKTSE